MTVGALQYFAGVHIPGEMEVLSAGEIDEGLGDILAGKNRTLGTSQLVGLGALAAQGVSGSAIIFGYRHRAIRRGGQAVTRTAIGGGGSGNSEPLAFQHPIRLEGLGSPRYFAALIRFVALKMTGQATNVSLFMGRDGVPGDKSRVMALAAGFILIGLYPGLPDDFALGIQKLEGRMHGIGRRRGQAEARGPEDQN
jgi:hypothetical protein